MRTHDRSVQRDSAFAHFGHHWDVSGLADAHGCHYAIDGLGTARAYRATAFLSPLITNHATKYMTVGVHHLFMLWWFLGAVFSAKSRDCSARDDRSSPVRGACTFRYRHAAESCYGRSARPRGIVKYTVLDFAWHRGQDYRLQRY